MLLVSTTSLFTVLFSSFLRRNQLGKMRSAAPIRAPTEKVGEDALLWGAWARVHPQASAWGPRIRSIRYNYSSGILDSSHTINGKEPKVKKIVFLSNRPPSPLFYFGSWLNSLLPFLANSYITMTLKMDSKFFICVSPLLSLLSSLLSSSSFNPSTNQHRAGYVRM